MGVLLQARANPKAKDEEGQTVLDYAVMFEHKDLVKLLTSEEIVYDSQAEQANANDQHDEQEAAKENISGQTTVADDHSGDKVEKKALKKRSSKLAVEPVLATTADGHNSEESQIDPEKAEKKLKKRSSKLAVEPPPVDEINAEENSLDPEKAEKKFKKRSSKLAVEATAVEPPPVEAPPVDEINAEE